ncbi:MAG: NDP-sugar synthase [Candidatus Lokiarchaeota archaeon]
MTKGLILSGGWGTRLRPLTCTIPKTLIPVGNIPVIERQILLLKEAGVKEIVLAVSVMADFLRAYFEHEEKLKGLKIHFTEEKSPMGTAGALKLAEPYLKDDKFFMLNGDVILNFNFKWMLDAHEKFGGVGTIASKMVEDPSRYGVLITNKETHQIFEFQEKEKYEPEEHPEKEVPINAGVYLLEPKVFSYIQPHKKLSIERDTFPKLVKNEKLFYYPIEGIWKDIGKPYELLEGNILLMKDILKKLDGKRNLIEESANVDGSVKIIPPVTIGENSVIRNNCIIGPNVIIGNDVYVEKNTKIQNSLIYNEVYISQNSEIEKSIISDNCHIRKGAKLKGNNESLVILASFVEVMENIELNAFENGDLSFCHHEVVKESLK